MSSCPRTTLRGIVNPTNMHQTQLSRYTFDVALTIFEGLASVKRCSSNLSQLIIILCTWLNATWIRPISCCRRMP